MASSKPIDHIKEEQILGGILRIMREKQLYKRFGRYLRPENVFRSDPSGRAEAIRTLIRLIHDVYAETSDSKITPEYVRNILDTRIAASGKHREEIEKLLADMFDPAGTITKCAATQGDWDYFIEYVKATIIAGQVGKAIDKYKNFKIEESVGEFKAMLSEVSRLRTAEDVELDPDDIMTLLGGTENSYILPQLSTGCAPLDICLGAFEARTLNLFLAPTNGGKSMFVQHLIRCCIEQGLHAHIVCVEDRPESFLRRLIASLTGIPLLALKREFIRMLSPEQKLLIDAARAKIAQYLRIEFIYGQGIDYIHAKKAEYDEWCRQTGRPVPIVDIVDYTGHVARLSDGEKVHEQMRAAYGSRKDFALKYNKIAFDFAQVNREGTKKLSGSYPLSHEDLAGAFDLAQVADNIVSINRNQDEKTGDAARLYISKARDGESGAIILVKTDFKHARWVMHDHNWINRKSDQKTNLDGTTPTPIAPQALHS